MNNLSANSRVYDQIAERIKSGWLEGASAQTGQKLPTQNELARHLGVSRSTVIRALAKLVSEGYLHSQQGSGVYVADNLSAEKSQATRQEKAPCLGLVIHHSTAPVIASVCRGVERRARQLGYSVLLASAEHGSAHEEELVQRHLKADVKGILVYPEIHRQSDLDRDYLAHWSHRIPIVTIDHGCDAWNCTQVQFDNFSLGREMTQHLLNHGHRRIAFMHTSPEYLYSSVHERQKGWEVALEEAGQSVPTDYRLWPVPVQDMGYAAPLTAAEYDRIADSLLALQPRPDAVIAWTDAAAAHLTQALINREIRVPQDIRITGFDCEPLITALFRPLFPTSRPDFVRLGEMAVEMLERTLTGQITRPRTYLHNVPVLWREPYTTPESRFETGQTKVITEVGSRQGRGVAPALPE